MVESIATESKRGRENSKNREQGSSRTTAHEVDKDVNEIMRL